MALRTKAILGILNYRHFHFRKIPPSFWKHLRRIWQTTSKTNYFLNHIHSQFAYPTTILPSFTFQNKFKLQIWMVCCPQVLDFKFLAQFLPPIFKRKQICRLAQSWWLKMSFTNFHGICASVTIDVVCAMFFTVVDRTFLTMDKGRQKEWAFSLNIEKDV